MIYKFLKGNIKQQNYKGEGVNNRGLIQVYFKVGDSIMVICVSNQLYQPIKEFNDSRPVRTITTVFFTDEDKINADRVWDNKTCK